MSGTSRWLIRVYWIFTVAAVLWLLICAAVWANDKLLAVEARDHAWQAWATNHCRIVSIATGVVGGTTAAYRCDDGRDYVSSVGDAPKDWIEVKR